MIHRLRRPLLAGPCYGTAGFGVLQLYWGQEILLSWKEVIDNAEAKFFARASVSLMRATECSMMTTQINGYPNGSALLWDKRLATEVVIFRRLALGF